MAEQPAEDGSINNLMGFGPFGVLESGSSVLAGLRLLAVC